MNALFKTVEAANTALTVALTDQIEQVISDHLPEMVAEMISFTDAELEVVKKLFGDDVFNLVVLQRRQFKVMMGVDELVHTFSRKEPPPPGHGVGIRKGPFGWEVISEDGETVLEKGAYTKAFAIQKAWERVEENE